MISKRVLKTAEGWLKKRDDLLEEERSALMSYVKPMKNVEALATTRWFVNEVIRVPEDLPKVSEAIIVAKKAKVDPLSYSSPMNILNTFKQYKIKEKAIDPDTVPELSNGRTVGPSSFSICVYYVEDSKDGQLAMRKIINTHWGEDANPWCLLQGDGEGNLSSDAWQYWNHYDAVYKRVAFKDGKLLAFCANDENSDCWWDRLDEPHDEIPFNMKIPNDELGREATYEMGDYGHLYGPFDIYRGNKQNGMYEEWNKNGQLVVRENYKNGKMDGVCERWWDNGKPRHRYSYKNGKMDGICEQWGDNGKLQHRYSYKNGVPEGVFWSWYESGQLARRKNYKDDQLDGLDEEWSRDGQLRFRHNYKENKLEGLSEEWYFNGQQRSKVHFQQGKREGEQLYWHPNGQMWSRENCKDGKREGLYEEWDRDGQLKVRGNYKDGQLHGLVETLNADGSVTRSIYNNGELQQEKRAKSFIKMGNEQRTIIAPRESTIVMKV